MAKQKTYIAIDLKSFYASVECKERNRDPLTTNLVVADKSRTEKTICLAVSPSLKSYGIPGRPRLFEVVQKVKEANNNRRWKAPNRTFTGSSDDSTELNANPALEIDYIVAPPRMAYYLEYSTKIYSVYLKYIAPEDIFPYSIDEVFIDATNYLNTYQMTARELAMTMIQDVLKTTGITATAGIGTNMYLCKIAMDIVAKHIEPDKDGVRIAELDEMSYRRQLWNHRPLTDFWRVGKGYAKKLEEHGLFTMDIVTIHSTQSKYFVASRKFELPELKLLIDAVESSKFITKKKSKTLIEKIHTMTSPGQVAKLKRNNYVVNRIKPDNEQIYYIIDAINDAINTGKQISFQYYDYTGLKKKVLKNKGEVYKLSPYKLLWCGDYYYVLGYSEKKRKVINFRVDRIASKPEILDKDIIPMPDDFDIENYTKEVFFMFSGEKVLVDLRCDNSLMKTMVDRFGEDVTTLAYDMTSFRVQTEVSASPTFFGWVFGFNGKVQILAPENLKEQYRQMLTKATEDMKENE